jgi:hypothetical protein
MIKNILQIMLVIALQYVTICADVTSNGFCENECTKISDLCDSLCNNYFYNTTYVDDINILNSECHNRCVKALDVCNNICHLIPP